MSTNAPEERPRVLLVEDDAAVRRSLQLLLRGHGLDVRAYATARQALADPQARSAACLVVDLVMPEIDGIALLAALRAAGWNGPAILISGQLTPERFATAGQAGFVTILRKPFADESIVETVHRVLADHPRTAA
jgi:FixJ family two-component response regulator